MAKPLFSETAVEISNRLYDGRKSEALQIMFAALANGSADGEVQRLAANVILDIIEAYTSVRGRPRQVGPRMWAEIGDYYKAERAKGRDHAAALRFTHANFEFSKEHVRKCVKRHILIRGDITT